MMFWIFAALLTAGCLFAVLRPMLSRRAGDAQAADYDVEVYKSQLAEVERDAARGQLGPEEAEAARTEIGRRLLEADRRRVQAHAAAPGAAPGFLHRLMPYAIAAALPAAAFGLYLSLGMPGAPDRPLASRGEERERLAQQRAANSQQEAQQGGQSLDASAENLRRRLADSPDDLEGWALLARTEMARGAYRAAAQAYRKARELADPAFIAELMSAQGEALTMAAEGVVSERAQGLFADALLRDPDDVRAAYYLAEADMQAGRVEQAMNRWIALAQAAPPGAPYLPVVTARAQAAAEQLGIDIADQLPDPAPPVAADQGASSLESLAARVVADPMDFQAWVGLIEGRARAGEPGLARQRLAEAREVFANAPFPRRELTQLAVTLGLEEAGTAAGEAPGDGPRGPDADDLAAAQDMSETERLEMIAGMVDGLAARLEENPDDLQGWRMLARSYQVLDRADEALAALVRAGQIAPDAIDIKILQARLLRERAGDQPTAESLALMREVDALDPDNVEANWFLGLEALQAGDRQAARTRLDRAIESLPPGSPEREQLTREVERLLAN
jgi:cytochrome c-type biogenesis protein CcmH